MINTPSSKITESGFSHFNSKDSTCTSKRQARRQNWKENQARKKQADKQGQSQWVDRSKYKTEMCKNWIEVGSCRYGKKCQFAHGDREQFSKYIPNNINYKSKVCKTFAEKGFCPYGTRCLFRHEMRTFEEVHNYFYTTKVNCLNENMAYNSNSDSEHHSEHDCAHNTDCQMFTAQGHWFTPMMSWSSLQTKPKRLPIFVSN